MLIHYFIRKKTTAESYRILCEVYGEHVLSQDIDESWFRSFRNDEFSVKDKVRLDRSSKFEHQQLQALLDEDTYVSISNSFRSLTCNGQDFNGRNIGAT